MDESISGSAREELARCLGNGMGAENIVLGLHQPYAVGKHRKVITGLDLSELINSAEPSGFSKNTKTSTQHYGIFAPGAQHSSKTALGSTSITTVHRGRTLTAARGVPFTVTTAVTDGSSEKTTTFGWVQENVRFGLLRVLGENIHGHTLFPHLVLKLQKILGNLPLAYYPSEFEEHCTSLDHEDFEKVVGLRRVFLLLYWAKLAEKKWLLTKQPDGSDYMFSHYLTQPEALQQFLKTL